MTLPVAILLSEWKENHTTISETLTIDEPPLQRLMENPFDAQATGGATQKRTKFSTKQTSKVVHQKTKGTSLKLILLKLDSLLRPNLKFNKFKPSIENSSASSNLPPAAYRKLKPKKPLPPPSKIHPYPPGLELSFSTFESQSNEQASLESHPWSNRKSENIYPEPLQFPDLPEINLQTFSYVSYTLGDYYQFQQIMTSFSSMLRIQQATILRKAQEQKKLSQVPHLSETLRDIDNAQEQKQSPSIETRTQNSNPTDTNANKKEKDTEEPQSNDSNTYFYPSLGEFCTKIAIEISETNKKLQGFREGMTLESTEPFDYFEKGVFENELMVHKILYESRQLFGDKIENVKPSAEKSTCTDATIPPLLTCDQLEKALTSKLSVHAEPFTFKPQNTASEKPRSKQKVNMEAYMDFLSIISGVTSKSSTNSECPTYATFLENVNRPAITENGEPLRSKKNTARKIAHTIDELQGQTLSPEEEAAYEKAQSKTAIGPRRSPGPSTCTALVPENKSEIWHNGRNVLDLGNNIRNGWNPRDSWQLHGYGKEMYNYFQNRNDREKEWQQRDFTNCGNCSFHYHAH